ncbi:MAG TPA: CHRD domain-containing protein [Actinomycetota bacterium]|nr:CHRD domain-containing protein [Actinomycetota bacterium]
MRRILPMLFAALLVPAIAGAAPAGQSFTASLSGGEEVPANDSIAAGQTIFTVSKDGDSMDYRLIVANIENVTQSHIHLAPAGANGGVVVWLYPSAPPAQLIPGRSSGTLATGTITEANLVGALAGQPLSVLLEHMRNGNAYVNVHTTQFPGGEIRGQIAAHGPQA